MEEEEKEEMSEGPRLKKEKSKTTAKKNADIQRRVILLVIA